eukprot:COSAG01_NODE_5091_length_4492_cov_3.461311_6_plen_49_part_00
MELRSMLSNFGRGPKRDFKKVMRKKVRAGRALVPALIGAPWRGRGVIG